VFPISSPGGEGQFREGVRREAGRAPRDQGREERLERDTEVRKCYMMPRQIARMGRQQATVGKSFLRAFGGGSSAICSRAVVSKSAQGFRLAALGRSAAGTSSRFGGNKGGLSKFSTECGAASVTPGTTQKATELEFYCGGAMYPSVDKTNGGEDSFFVTYVNDNGLQSTGEADAEDESYMSKGFMMMGVADGVGGWATSGVDAGHYSRQLMHLSNEFSQKEDPSNPNPKRVLFQAVQNTDKKGSATVCIVSLSPSEQGASLRAANLGDSGFIVIRQKQVMFVSPIQQHSFNFPYQVSSIPQYSDSPMKAETFNLDVLPGDTVILGSDGLLDNLFPDEMATIVYQAKANGTKPGELAHILAKITMEVAIDKTRETPFAAGARQAGFPHEYGGKMDDVSVVVAYIQQGSKL